MDILDLLKLLFFCSVLPAFLGILVIVLGWVDPEVRSFLWPFDGILALLGGVAIGLFFMVDYMGTPPE